jgi:uncharacterized protein
MNRDEAYTLLTKMMSNQNLIKHGLAVEAIMRSLCYELKVRHAEFGSEEFDEEEWAIVGLLHDADYELIEKDPSRHTLVTEEKLREIGGVNERIIRGIKAHHDGITESRDNLMEKAVYSADEMSGLITAVALVKDRKLSNVSVESVLKKFPEKNFAAGARRDQIETGVKELEMELPEFTSLCLKAMQGISDKLGL